MNMKEKMQRREPIRIFCTQRNRHWWVVPTVPLFSILCTVLLFNLKWGIIKRSERKRNSKARVSSSIRVVKSVKERVLLIEMKKFVDPDRKHHFFKIILKEDETRMKIPDAFYPRISTEPQSCGQAVVYGPSGAYWVTKVNKSQDGIFLEKGWEVFVRENGIQIYDFLVFRYDGSLQFSVKVFDMRGVPREECFAPIRSSPLITHGRSSEDENEDESDEEESDEEESNGDESYEEKSDEEESDEDEDEYEVHRKTLKLNSSRKERSKSIDVPRANRIECGFTSSSRYPFFKIRMQNSYLKHNYLPIPWGARRKYFPDDVKEVILKASDEKWYWKD